MYIHLYIYIPYILYCITVSRVVYTCGHDGMTMSILLGEVEEVIAVSSVLDPPVKFDLVATPPSLSLQE